MKITTEQLEQIKNNIEAGLSAIGIEVEAREFPQIGDVYYFKGVSGTIGTFAWMGDKTDKKLMTIGNCHRTREEAEAYPGYDLLADIHAKGLWDAVRDFVDNGSELLAAIARLKAANDFVPDWGDEKLLKERCSWGHVGKQWGIEDNRTLQTVPDYLCRPEGQALAFYNEHDADIKIVMGISEVK